MKTARPPPESVATKTPTGVAGFVVKPFTRESLQLNLEKILPR